MRRGYGCCGGCRCRIAVLHWRAGVWNSRLRYGALCGWRAGAGATKRYLRDRGATSMHGQRRRVRHGFVLDGDSDVWLHSWLFQFKLHRRAYATGAVLVVAVLVGAQPQQVREEIGRAPVPLARALGVAIEVCVLSVVAAARVVLNRLRLAVRLGLDVLVELVVLRELPQDRLLPLVCPSQPCTGFAPESSTLSPSCCLPPISRSSMPPSFFRQSTCFGSSFSIRR